AGPPQRPGALRPACRPGRHPGHPDDGDHRRRDLALLSAPDIALPGPAARCRVVTVFLACVPRPVESALPALVSADHTETITHAQDHYRTAHGPGGHGRRP